MPYPSYIVREGGGVILLHSAKKVKSLSHFIALNIFLQFRQALMVTLQDGETIVSEMGEKLS